MIYDIAIIGAGPAGLTAALFGERRGLSCVVFDSVEDMALIEKNHMIENWPGTRAITGPEMHAAMKSQIKSEIKQETVVALQKGRPFIVQTDSGRHEAKTIIIATGSVPRKGDVKGEEEYTNKGVSYCINCDGPLFNGKKVFVIGGGDSALRGAMALKDMGAFPTIVHRRDEFRAEEALQRTIREQRIPAIMNAIVEEISGDQFVKKIRIKNVLTGAISEHPAEGVFMEIGSAPLTKLAADLGVQLSPAGFITVNAKKQTNVPGIYAAGDVTDTPLRQIITACADGAIAAISAYTYIKEQD